MVHPEDPSIATGNTASKLSLFHQNQAQTAGAGRSSSKAGKHGKKKGLAAGIPKIPDSSIAREATFHSQQDRQVGEIDDPDKADSAFFSPLLNALNANTQNLSLIEDQTSTSQNEPTRIHQLRDAPRNQFSGQDFVTDPAPSERTSPPLAKAPNSPRSFPNVDRPNMYSPPQRYRRASMFSNRPNLSPDGNPPLPHHPQAHFYGVPQLDLGDGEQHPRSCKPGTNGGVSKFDSLQMKDSSGRRYTEDIILSGWNGGIDAQRLSRGRTETIGRLAGLRGLVVDAKIIPFIDNSEGSSLVQHLIAIVVHGPRLTNEKDALHPTDSAHATGHPNSSGLAALIDASDPVELSDEYVTSAEIYSLEQSEPVAVLYTTPPKTSPVPLTSPIFQAPDVIGQLRVSAAGRFVLVTSGESGEIFIFRIDSSHPERQDLGYAVTCLGKTWTAVAPFKQKDHSRKSSATDLRGANEQHSEENQSNSQPLLALSERWLAYSPPTATKGFLQGSVLVPGRLKKIPGLSSHRAPLQPTTNCSLESPENEGMIDWMARGVTQEVIKGAKWVGEKAAQTFSAYWNSTPDLSTSSNRAEHGHGGSPQFPPTHAFANQASADFSSATLVSFIDLDRLSKLVNPESGIVPTATFSAPQGCGFLSFSPNGLNLLITNAKGDVQTVWDLMRLSPGRIQKAPSRGGSSSVKPVIRQVARFTRMTTAVFVDALWMKPKGHKLAMITNKGTVHVHDLPQSALQWPPPRQKIRRSSDKTQKSDLDKPRPTSFSAATAATSAVSVMGAAFRYVNSTAQPMLSGNVSKPVNSPPRESKARRYGALTQYRPPSSHAVAQGFSKSLGAATGTVNNIRNAGENRIQVPSQIGDIGPGCAMWLSGKSTGNIAVLGHGNGKVHRVGYRILDNKGDKRRVAVAKTTLTFQLATIPDLQFAPVVAEHLAPTDPQPSSLQRGFWNLRSRSTVAASDHRASLQMHVEINPCAPYLPFHTDRRVEIFVYDKSEAKKGSPFPFVFGEDIPVRKLDFGFFSNDEPDDTHADLVTSMENAKVAGKGDEVQDHIVFTTRKKRNKNRSDDASTEAHDGKSEGFFEDDLEILDFAGDRV